MNDPPIKLLRKLSIRWVYSSDKLKRVGEFKSLFQLSQPLLPGLKPKAKSSPPVQCVLNFAGETIRSVHSGALPARAPRSNQRSAIEGMTSSTPDLMKAFAAGDEVLGNVRLSNPFGKTCSRRL